MKKRMFVSLFVGSFLLILGACASTDTQDSEHEEHSTVTEASTSDTEEEMMHHHGSGEIPANMVPAVDPKYPIGATVKLTATHMPGMDGAEATVAGAYDTTIYEVTYTPTDDGPEVANHKWVVHEELQDPGNPALPGDTVVLEADHMEGMQGATAVVTDAIEGTVYVVNYQPTDGGEMMTNHMWVTEDEMTEE
ncbi:YdhK family protein [Enterococcus olivae]